MSTVGALIDRLFRTYLYPPDLRPAQCFLDGAITASDTTLTVSDFVLPEDELLMAAGVVIELDAELVQVVSYVETTLTATVIRGFMGTTAASHVDNTPVILSPPYSRQSAFDAVADNIVSLYPRLYTVTAGALTPVSAGVATLDDVLAVEVIEAWPDDSWGVKEVDARIVDFHPSTGGRSLVTNIGTGSLWVRYRRRFGDATAESDTFADLGLETRWANIVVAGAAADLMSGRDISEAHTDWVGAVLKAENIPVGTRGEVGQRLAAYKEYMVNLAAREMRAEYRAKVHMRNAARVVTRGAFG